jgi:MFS family permease
MRLAQAISSKAILLLGVSLFTVGCAISGISYSINTLIIGRAIAGSGYGSIATTSLLIIRQLANSSDDHTSETSRSAAFWFGLAIGPILGGACAQIVGWSYALWVNVPLAGMALVVLPCSLELPWSNGQVWTSLLDIDLVGFILLSGSAAPLFIAISWAGPTYSWSSWQTLVPLLVGLVLLSVFTRYTVYRDGTILPDTIFRNGSAGVSSFGTFIHGAIVTALIYFLPICLVATHGLAPAVAGTALTSWTLTMATAGLLAAAFAPLFGHRWFIWSGWFLVAFGSGLLILGNERSSTALYAGLGVIPGTGLGLLYPSLSAAIQTAATTDEETIYAAPLHSFFSMLGQAAGLTVGSSVFFNQLERSLAASPAWAADAQAYTKDAFLVLDFIRLASPGQDALKNGLLAISYVDALRWVWMTLSVLAGLAMVFAIWYTEDKVSVREKVEAVDSTGPV